MSSGKNLRNIVKRRTYRERSQPEARRKLGMLEKHKDYVIRAKDYHRKKDTLDKLQQKAALRNPDEFYFGMTKTKTTGGVHEIGKSNYKFPKEVAIIKNQQLQYLQMTKTSETHKLDRMRSHLHFLTEKEIDEDDDEEDDDKGADEDDMGGEDEGGFGLGMGMGDEDDQDEDGDTDQLMAMLKAQSVPESTSASPFKSFTSSKTSTSKSTSISTQPPFKKAKTTHPSTTPVDDDSPIPLSLSASSLSTSSTSSSTSSKKKSLSTTPSTSSHVIFVDTPEAAHTFSATKYFDTPKQLLGRSYNRPTHQQLAKTPIATVNKRVRDKLDASRALQYQEMVARMQRKRKIEGMVEKLQTQKHLTSKGARRKIVTLDKFGEVDESKTIYKWKQERKK